jgi:hypothetical protein
VQQPRGRWCSRSCCQSLMHAAHARAPVAAANTTASLMACGLASNRSSPPASSTCVHARACACACAIVLSSRHQGVCAGCCRQRRCTVHAYVALESRFRCALYTTCLVHQHAPCSPTHTNTHLVQEACGEGVPSPRCVHHIQLEHRHKACSVCWRVLACGQTGGAWLLFGAGVGARRYTPAALCAAASEHSHRPTATPPPTPTPSSPARSAHAPVCSPLVLLQQ